MMAVLREFPSYIAFRERTSRSQSTTAADRPGRCAGSPEISTRCCACGEPGSRRGDPEERHSRCRPPFEDLLSDFWRRWAGRAGAVERGEFSGDAGIDGISQDLPLTASTCRPSDTPSTKRLAGRRSTSSAPSWASRATGASGHHVVVFPRCPRGKLSGSTPDRTHRRRWLWPSALCGIESASRRCRPSNFI